MDVKSYFTFSPELNINAQTFSLILSPIFIFCLFTRFFSKLLKKEKHYPHHGNKELTWSGSRRFAAGSQTIPRVVSVNPRESGVASWDCSAAMHNPSGESRVKARMTVSHIAYKNT